MRVGKADGKVDGCTYFFKYIVWRVVDPVQGRVAHPAGPAPGDRLRREC